MQVKQAILVPVGKLDCRKMVAPSMRKPVCVKQIYSQSAIPSSQSSPASRPGPVQAERSEPEGSLDGWPRCVPSRWREWQSRAQRPMLLLLLESSPFLAPLPFALFWSHYQLCASWGPQSDDGCCSLIADLACPR